MGGPDDKSPLPDFSGSSPRGHQGRRGSLLGEHEIVGDIRTDLGMSGRRLAADAVGHRCRAGQESSEASAVIVATSSWVSWMRAAARFSLKCCTLVVPGIGSALGVR